MTTASSRVMDWSEKSTWAPGRLRIKSNNCWRSIKLRSSTGCQPVLSECIGCRPRKQRCSSRRQSNDTNASQRTLAAVRARSCGSVHSCSTN